MILFIKIKNNHFIKFFNFENLSHEERSSPLISFSTRFLKAPCLERDNLRSNSILFLSMLVHFKLRKFI